MSFDVSRGLTAENAMAALHVLSPVQPFPTQLPRIAYMVVHAALQLVVFVLYVCAVDLDVSWWRDEGALCDAEVPCSQEINGDVCESMRTDLEWLFWGHCIGVAVAVNKVVVVLGLLAAGTEAGLGMLLAVPVAQHGRHSERNSRLLVCAAWGFSLCLDAGLLFSLCCQVVVTHVRSADYKEDLFPDTAGGGVAATVLLSLAVGVTTIVDCTMLGLAVHYHKQSLQSKADAEI